MSGPVIRAAGGVLWRHALDARDEPSVEVAVVHRPRYDDWSLPKGKLAPGEPEVEGAVREVLEETGYHVRVGRPLGETRYEKIMGTTARPKVVRWWAMEALGGTFSPTREVDRLRWVPLGEAETLLTRDTDRELLAKFAHGPAPTRTVLVVRHASAGQRSAWTGDDSERPLDDCGVAQADELVRLLTRYDVGEIVAADVARCVQTVAPLAGSLSLPIAEAPVLSEAGYPGREDEALGVVRGIGGANRDGVACTQGDVIPDLLRRFAATDQIDLPQPLTYRKASTWALTFSDGRLLSLEYFDPPAPGECTDGAGA